MLTVVVRGGRPRRLAVGEELTLGRASRCDIVVPDLRVSREHAQVEWKGPTPWFVDTSSTGTYHAAGHPVTATPITSAMELRLGSVDGPELQLAPEPDQPIAHATGPALRAQGLELTLPAGPVLVERVDLEVDVGTLTAVLGPTGAGKSTLLRLLAGLAVPTTGSVQVLGRDLAQHYPTVRSEIGYVPQDDIVHTRLTARQAWSFGAELRLPETVDDDARRETVTATARDLGLSEHLDKRVSNLSGGQRKRVSVGLELLTRPSLLLLDEPTSGLDPAYEETIMRLLRTIADGGCTVVVVTHSTATLGICDQVVYLGTGGWVGYAGPPATALAELGVEDQPAAFRLLEQSRPRDAGQEIGEAAHVEGRNGVTSPGTGAVDVPGADIGPAHPTGAAAQFATLLRRSAVLLASDPRSLGVLAASAVVPGLLLALVVGPGSFSVDGDSTPGSGRTLLTGVIIAAGVIGAANGLREIVKELPIYRRERVAGLRRSAYLASKVVALGVVTVAQTALLVLVATALAGPPDGNLLPAHAELFAAAAGTAVVSLLIGLLISALVDSSEKALAMIPVVFVVLWILSGTVSDLADTPLISQLSYLSPSNWGAAAGASAVDLVSLEDCAGTATPPGGAPPSCDARWDHSVLQYGFDLLVLGLLGVAAYLATDWALSRREVPPQMRTQHLVGEMLRRVRS